MQAGFTLAQTLAHPFSFSFTLGWNTSHAAYRGEGTAAQDWAERAVAFPTEHRFEYQIGFNTILQGWVRAKQGQVGEGLRQLREGLTRYQATGAKMALPSCFAWLTEAYIQGDQRAAGLATVAEGLALVDHTGERVYEAELYRLQGELLLAQGPAHQPEGEAAFQHALTVARQQEAKSWELRAATSLARLWQQQGKKVEAHGLLAPVYCWFTEGFDTADLKDAKTLLEELA